MYRYPIRTPQNLKIGPFEIISCCSILVFVISIIKLTSDNTEKAPRIPWIILASLSVMFMMGFLFIKFQNKKEGFEAGKFCPICSGKTPNQCMGCFNCGWCVDEDGNGSCIGGSVNEGPFNNERCAQFYHGDPFYRMKQDNKNQRCSDGPRSYNRIIGV